MAVASAQPPVSAEVVGHAFVQQYYHILHQSPSLVHRFYQDISKLGRPEDNGTMSITTTMQAIDDKILSLNYSDFRAEIKSVDAQESFNDGVHVLVTGYLTGTDNLARNFAQSFFLAPQDRGYFVLNDMFRYLEDATQPEAHMSSVNNVEPPVVPQQDPPVLQENHIAEQTTGLVEEANGEVCDPSENGEVPNVEEEVPVVEEEVPIVEEEVPVAEVVDEVQNDSQMAAESNIKIEEVPKKSYASILMDLKDSAVPFSSPPPRKSVPKSLEQHVNPAPPPASAAEFSAPNSDAVENGNNQEGEADGYSIYLKGLPINATIAQLEEEFKRFGPIKIGGIQVRSNRQQGFCFGFVEFETVDAMQKAVEASPVAIGGRNVVVEEKRSTNSRGNRRFPPGRGSGYRNEGFRNEGFRNEGMRGRGNYGGGRGYGRGDFSGRTEFGNRSNNRGGLSNRISDGYQRADNMGSNGGRVNRSGGMAANGTAKNMAPRVPATA